MKQMWDKKKHWQEIGEERIDHLFSLAEKEHKTHPQRAHRYVELARKIAMRYNIRLTKYKRKFCPKCYRYIIPGENSRVRAKQSVITTCHECGHVSRRPYKKGNKLKPKKK